MDSSAIAAALVAKLAADATLAALMQPGAFVFVDIAPPGSKKFVLVSLVTGDDLLAFGIRAAEDHLYAVEARMLSTAGGNMRAAALRIDELLDEQPLAIEGYTLMTLHREHPIRDTDPDQLDPSILYHRRGGIYRLWAST